MTRATNEQVQNYADVHFRPRAEQVRAVLAALKDAKASIDDIYEHVSGANQIASTWEDSRTDAPPFLLSANDILAYNAFITDVIAAIEGNGNFAVVMQGCVRPVGQ